MRGISYVACAVCSGHTVAEDGSCTRCNNRFTFAENFANKESFLQWKDYIGALKTENEKKGRGRFLLNKISLFSNCACFHKNGSDYVTIYRGDGSPTRLDGVVDYSVGVRHSVMLHKNGTVTAQGSNSDGQCDLADLRNIKCVYAGANCTYAVNEDGKVIVRGFSTLEDTLSEWSDIKKIVGSKGRLVGLTTDGRVKIADDMQKVDLNVTDATDIDTTYNFSVWLKNDGTVGCFGKKSDERNRATEWENIIAVGVDNNRIIGMLNDGTVKISERQAGAESFSQENVVSAMCSDFGTIVVLSDGTVKIIGNIENKERIEAEFSKDIAEVLQESIPL